MSFLIRFDRYVILIRLFYPILYNFVKETDFQDIEMNKKLKTFISIPI